MNYRAFLENKSQLSGDFGFEPTFLPDCLFDFQRAIVEWSIRKGRGAEFADCGLGKTLMQLVWAQNIVEKTNRPVIVMTPLAVAHQTVREAEKFGIEAVQSRDGKFPESARIIVTNYERLHYFNREDFAGAVCDESSILKNYSGATRKAITDFIRPMKFRLLCTATAAPNDYMELGTSAEALGVMKRVEMLASFFNHDGGDTAKWRLKGHAAKGEFWRWLSSWSRAIQKPSDMGFDDKGFALPPLKLRDHIVESEGCGEFLFAMPAIGLAEQRAERKRTLPGRCEIAAEIVTGHDDSCVSWCHLNSEGDMLERLIPDAVQVSGSDKEEFKEESFRAFEAGEIRVIVSKPSIAGFGLNWQHCHRQTFFPSHSFEQWYQAIRRCWRFGQDKPVEIDMISSDGEAGVLANLKRKADQAEALFASVVKHMDQEFQESKPEERTLKQIIPSWL